MIKVQVHLIRSLIIKDLPQKNMDLDTRKMFMKKGEAPRQQEMKKQMYI